MIEPTAGPRYVSAAEAARLLGVSRQTLYAYVSRGRLRSEPDPRSPRSSRYLASDVRRLAEQKEARLRPEVAARGALDWGRPVLESSLTLIDGGRLYYRGRDALDLAERAEFEDVVRLLWGWEAKRPRPPVVSSQGTRDHLSALRFLPAVERMQAVLPVAAHEDAGAFDVRRETVTTTGWRILDLLTAAATLESDGGGSFSERLARGWHVRGRERRRLLEMALILCADHELNVSAFTVRVVASTRSSPYDAVAAGLAALRGPLHGGHTARVEGLLDEAATADALRRTMADRIRRGEAVPGFGHPLYPDGDPRAKVIASAVEAAWPRSAAVAFLEAGRAAGRELLGEEPTLDWGLVLLRRALRLPRGSALVLFALGRTAGWVAHAMEQYEADQLIRPRAAYVGPPLG